MKTGDVRVQGRGARDSDPSAVVISVSSGDIDDALTYTMELMPSGSNDRRWILLSARNFQYGAQARRSCCLNNAAKRRCRPAY